MKKFVLLVTLVFLSFTSYSQYTIPELIRLPDLIQAHNSTTEEATKFLYQLKYGIVETTTYSTIFKTNLIKPDGSGYIPIYLEKYKDDSKVEIYNGPGQPPVIAEAYMDYLRMNLVKKDENQMQNTYYYKWLTYNITISCAVSGTMFKAGSCLMTIQ